jgi:hypothetical protein
MICQLRKNPEDQLGLRVTPPRRAEHFASYGADNAWQRAILRHEQAMFLENGKYRNSRLYQGRLTRP